ncbi:hypothetical protein SAY87_014582 [Trapa incisa]|uniref:Uncharacterized protein n=1 Tax=Trapa incisa TaxID=236973 RepID=A0AAN7JDG0_9MYRT|nr:hypothetical protein SAY87_014582 [Trapa incisa]
MISQCPPRSRQPTTFPTSSIRQYSLHGPCHCSDKWIQAIYREAATISSALHVSSSSLPTWLPIQHRGLPVIIMIRSSTIMKKAIINRNRNRDTGDYTTLDYTTPTNYVEL